MLLFWYWYIVKIYEIGKIFTWILVISLCSWKMETLVLKVKDQKFQTMQL